MTIDPLVIVGFIGAMLSLLALILKKAIAGELTDPSKVVPIAHYNALLDINASYPAIIERVAVSVEKVAASLGRVADNGSPKEPTG